MVLNDPILCVSNLHVAHSEGRDTLRGASFSVEKVPIVSIIGDNGAGKTTLLNAISGMLRYDYDPITDGQIEFNGRKIHNLDTSGIIREGIVHIIEARREFSSLTIEENLILGASAWYGKPSKTGIETVYDYFPALLPRKKTMAFNCGIGELQMLAVGRALMSMPEIILPDEPYQRIFPILAEELFTVIKRINRDKGITFIFVERNPSKSFDIADEVYLMADGEISRAEKGRFNSIGQKVPFLM